MATQRKKTAKPPAPQSGAGEPVTDVVVPPPETELERRRRLWTEFKAAPDSMDRIVAVMVEGRSLHAFVLELGFISYNGMLDWIEADPARAANYARGRDLRADFFAQRRLEVAEEPVPLTAQGSYDSAAVADKKVRMDAYAWTAARMAPKRYGDKLEVDATHKHDVVGELAAFLSARTNKLPIKAEDA